MKVYHQTLVSPAKALKRGLYRSTQTGLLCLSVLIMPLGSLNAQSPDTDLTEFAATLPDEVKRQIAQRPEQYLQVMSQHIFQISPTGVATRDAAQVQRQRQFARVRSQEITTLLRLDLDGDGNVTSAEIDTQIGYMSTQERGQIAVKLLELDENGDQVLSLTEILESARAWADQQNRGNIDQTLDTVMAFDADEDGRVDLNEVASVLAAMDPADLENLPRRNPMSGQTRAACTAPKPQTGAEVVFLSGYEGAAVSTLAVSGQDKETSVATITISEGSTPLYVFATAHDSIVWKFDGATERVQQLVVQPRSTADGPGAAVAGIASDDIAFVEPSSCISGYMHQRSASADAQLTRLSAYLGQPFDHVVIGYTISDFQVPPATSASSEPTTEDSPYRTPVTFSIEDRSYELSATGMVLTGIEPQTTAPTTSSRSPIRSMMRFYSGGLIALSPEDVHATAEIAPYNVLPQQAGLLQLIAEGSIVQQDDDSFHIEEPIARFPAGLNGAHSVTFVLGTGIEMPAGSPGHSTVYSQETGACLVGHRCQ